MSRAILEEFLDVREAPKVANYTSEKDVAVFLNTLKNAAKKVHVKSKFKAVKEDPDDDAMYKRSTIAKLTTLFQEIGSCLH